MNTKIVGCATVREEDGLAMSSRNVLLSARDREIANILYSTLLYCKKKFKTEDRHKLESQCFNILKKTSEPDYFEIRNASNLSKEGEENYKWRAFVASRFGAVRLIDNIGLN